MAMNTMYGIFFENVWRDEKTGKSCFLFKTTTLLFDKNMYQREEIIRNSVTKEDEKWFTVFCNASDISVPARAKNTPIKITGNYDVTPNMKWEFVAKDVTDATNDEAVTIQFLSHKPFDGLLTPEDVSNIVGKYGHDIFALAEGKEPEKKLMSVTSLDYKQAANVVSMINKSVLEKKLFDFLSQANIPYPYTLKLINKYGKTALPRMKKNPYQTGRDIGLNFRQCDTIARLDGHSPVSAERVRMAGEEVLKNNESSGHVYTYLDDFIRKITKKMEVEGFVFTLPVANIVTLLGEGFRYERMQGKQIIYRKALVDAEKRAAKNIMRLASVTTAENYNDALIDYAEKACNIKYGKQQRAAFSNTLSKRGVKIVTGGPGTGKTTTIKGILLAYQRLNPEHVIRLAAPTGRAAQRMQESTGRNATTIHKLLDYRPYGENLSYKDANNPVNADLIIIDEVSMVDIELFDILLEAIKTGTTLILVGDIHQLESVGPGAILRDLLKTSESIIKKSLLTDVFRQKGDSPIIENAKRINEGNNDLWEGKGFQILNTKSSEESLEVVMNLSKKLYNEDDPFQTQILCPARSGLVGIDSINIKLHDLLNKETADDKVLIYGSVRYRCNDKVILTRNNPNVGYYNGDIGVIREVKNGELVIDIRNEEILITKDNLDDLRLSYGMTIHKSQGSEFPNVIVVMPMEPKNMLVRNLFYTGVTRAKEKVFIINEATAMQTAIKVDKSLDRKTMLLSFMPN